MNTKITRGPSLKTVRLHEETYQALIGLLMVRETMDQLLQRLIGEVLAARASSRRRRQRTIQTVRPLGTP